MHPKSRSTFVTTSRGMRGWMVASAVLLGACGGEAPPAEAPPAPAELLDTSAQLHTGYIVHPDGSPRLISYEVKGGQARPPGPAPAAPGGPATCGAS